MAVSQILIIAAEASADRHASRLVQAMNRLRSDLHFVGIGGSQMKTAGVEIVVDADQMNVIGFLEVVRRYRFLRSVFNRVLDIVRQRRPTAAILVDYPGFNLRLAPKLRALGIPVIYYIAPQVWAWKEGRVKALRRYVNDLIVVFPFEVEYFHRHNVPVHYFGHPLLDDVQWARLGQSSLQAPEAEQIRPHENSTGESLATVAYLPGSRPEELQRHMPIVIDVINRIGPEYRHVILRASTIADGVLRRYLEQCSVAVDVASDARSVLGTASAALVKSGTSTLEAALSGVPFAVMYRTSLPSFLIARLVIKVPWIAMVNILAGRCIVREFIQTEADGENIAEEILRLIEDHDYRERIRGDLAEVRRTMGQPGHAERTARFIVEHYLGPDAIPPAE
jgi:lipid-A-disaccharide synthase